MSNILPVLTGIIACVAAYGQHKKYFAVDSRQECTRVHLSVDAKAGNYIIQSHKGPELINVFSNEQHGDGLYQLQQRQIGPVQKIAVEINNDEEQGFTRSISRRMLGDETLSPEECLWKVFLSESKPYRLDLDYAVGNANLDLSGLSIEHLNINTGSADVEISYDQAPNKLVMDTFHVKVDMGSLVVHDISRARSRMIEAEVGFGSLMLDFSERPTVTQLVRGTVGAGSMVILLPDKSVPILVRISDSWLSSIAIPDDFQQVGENIFANPACSYSKSSPMKFDLDVAMGRIILREKSSD